MNFRRSGDACMGEVVGVKAEPVFTAHFGGIGSESCRPEEPQDLPREIRQDRQEPSQHHRRAQDAYGDGSQDAAQKRRR